MSGWIVWWEMCWRWYCCQYADVNTDRYSADCDVDTDRYRAHWCQSRQIQWEQCCQYIKLQKCQHRHVQTGTFSTDNAVNTKMYVALRGNVELPVNERFASPRLTQSVEKRPSGVIIRNTTLLLIQFYSSQPTQIMHVFVNVVHGGIHDSIIGSTDKVT